MGAEIAAAVQGSMLPCTAMVITTLCRHTQSSGHSRPPKGHEYVTLFANVGPDPTQRRVIFVTDGKDTAPVEVFEANLRAHHGRPSEIEAVSIDRSPAFISGVGEHLPNAQITFDKFHVIAMPRKPSTRCAASSRSSTRASRASAGCC